MTRPQPNSPGNERSRSSTRTCGRPNWVSKVAPGVILIGLLTIPAAAHQPERLRPGITRRGPFPEWILFTRIRPARLAVDSIGRWEFRPDSCDGSKWKREPCSAKVLRY